MFGTGRVSTGCALHSLPLRPLQLLLLLPPPAPAPPMLPPAAAAVGLKLLKLSAALMSYTSRLCPEPQLPQAPSSPHASPPLFHQHALLLLPPPLLPRLPPLLLPCAAKPVTSCQVSSWTPTQERPLLLACPCLPGLLAASLPLVQRAGTDPTAS